MSRIQAVGSADETPVVSPASVEADAPTEVSDADETVLDETAPVVEASVVEDTPAVAATGVKVVSIGSSAADTPATEASVTETETIIGEAQEVIYGYDATEAAPVQTVVAPSRTVSVVPAVVPAAAVVKATAAAETSTVGSVGAPVVTPGAVFAGETTTLTAASEVTHPLLLPSGVHLRQNDGEGFSFVSRMLDDGANGDATAGDAVFTGRFNASPAEPGEIELQTAAFLLGGIFELSDVTKVEVSPDLDWATILPVENKGYSTEIISLKKFDGGYVVAYGDTKDFGQFSTNSSIAHIIVLDDAGNRLAQKDVENFNISSLEIGDGKTALVSGSRWETHPVYTGSIIYTPYVFAWKWEEDKIVTVNVESGVCTWDSDTYTQTCAPSVFSILDNEGNKIYEKVWEDSSIAFIGMRSADSVYLTGTNRTSHQGFIWSSKDEQTIPALPSPSYNVKLQGFMEGNVLGDFYVTYETPTILAHKDSIWGYGTNIQYEFDTAGNLVSLPSYHWVGKWDSAGRSIIAPKTVPFDIDPFVSGITASADYSFFVVSYGERFGDTNGDGVIEFEIQGLDSDLNLTDFNVKLTDGDQSFYPIDNAIFVADPQNYVAVADAALPMADYVEGDVSTTMPKAMAIFGADAGESWQKTIKLDGVDQWWAERVHQLPDGSLLILGGAITGTGTDSKANLVFAKTTRKFALGATKELTAGFAMASNVHTARDGQILTAQIPNEVSFSAASSSDPLGSVMGYEWKIDDAVVSTDKYFTQLFAAAGTYMVSLRVKNNLGAWSSPVSGTIKAAEALPTAGFTATAADGQTFTEGGAGYFTIFPEDSVTVNFTADRSFADGGTIVGYEWVIDDRLVSTDASFSYAFKPSITITITSVIDLVAANSTNHTVNLTVTDSEGKKSTSIVGLVVINLFRPTAVISMSSDGENWFWDIARSVVPGEGSVTISFSADNSYGTGRFPIAGYEWTINGAVVSTESNFNYLFSERGTYMVTLVVTDSSGRKSNTASGTIVVFIYTKPPELDAFLPFDDASSYGGAASVAGGLWSSRTPGAYDTTLDTLPIPESAYVYIAVGTPIPDAIAGYTKVDSIAGLRPGQYAVYENDSYGFTIDYVILVPFPYVKPTELDAFYEYGLWSDVRTSGIYDPTLSSLGIPENAYVYGGLDWNTFVSLPVPDYIAGYTRAGDIAGLQSGQYAVYEIDYGGGLVCDYVILVP
jgi:PKD repeat protein